MFHLSRMSFLTKQNLERQCRLRIQDAEFQIYVGLEVEGIACPCLFL